MSDSSDTSISPIIHKGKRKATVLTDTNEESDSSSASDLEVTVVRRNGKRKARIRESESESDSSIDKLRKIKRVPRVTSDSESSCSSDESVIIRTKKPARVVSDNSNESVSDSDGSGVTDNGFEDNTSDEWESDWISESEIEPQVTEKTDSPAKITGTTSTLANLGNISDSSDGETEKCPICLLSFNQQEVGTPETCDHSFCAECIQEWSKNVNTCPVDRQTFTLILVRKRYNGKVIRRVPVDVRRPSVDELIQEDPTYCEICGMSDREDRLLLCDGCDLGYHLECLDPPLDTVPVEEWFCSICRGSGFNQGNQQENHNNQQSRRNHRVETRLLPRTSQSERIRATIETNRHNLNFHVDQQSLSSGFEDLSVPGTSRNSSNSATRSRSRNIGPTTNRKKKKSSRRKRKTRRTRYSITYEICDKTGEKIAIKTKLKTKRRRKYKRRSTRRTVKPKTVKKRLAFQLGMCPPKKAGLAVPEVKVKSNASNSGNIGYQRSQAGIPTLHLFGQRDQLDYFSESDDEIATMATTAGAGNAILTQTRSDVNSIISLRRAARRKAAVLSPVPPSSVNSCDILGSILDSQAKLHSKHSVISVSRDGTIRIENDTLSKSEKNNNIIKSDTNEVINDNPPLDITSRNNEIETTQAPMFPGRGSGNRQSYGFNRGGYRGNDNRYDNHSGSGYNNFQSGGNRGRGGGYGFGHNQRDNYSGGSNYMNYHHHTGPSPPFRGRGGVRFPMRRPNFEQHQQQSNQITESEPVDLVLDDPVEQNPDQNDFSTSQEHEEDIDIYSDIEDNTQTHEEEDVHIKPPSVEPHTVPGLVSQAYNNSDDDDSGSELVIDDTKETDKYDPTQPSADTDSNSESGANIKEKITSDDNSPKEEVQKLNVSENTAVKSQESENLIAQPEEEKEQIPTTTATTLSNPISQQVVKQVVQEVIQEHLNIPSKSNTTCDDNDSSDEDCPNFSIYSSTSIDIAKSTDYSADIPVSSSKTEEIESNMSKQELEQQEDDSELVQQTLDNTENESIDNKLIEQSEKNTTAPDNYDASDDWDACDAENAQKSWEESYQPPVEGKTNESDEKPELDKETNEDNLSSEKKVDVIDIEDERSIHSESNDQDNKIIELDDETDVNSTNDETEKIETIDITDDPDEAPLDKDINYDDSDKSPKPDTISISVESEQSMIVESLTPPLPPFSIPMPAEPSPQKPSPIKIAFNPNTRKIQKTDPENKKEKVFQLYDDSDYEEWELKNMDKSTKDDESSASNVNDLEKMTEAISEEERSYTPCLDEKDPTKVHYTEEDKNVGAGIGGMDTEMISDEERNDFDESHDMKTISDGDALEINAKESELELARPEDYEEGEIVEKSGTKVPPETPVEKTPKVNTFEEDKKKRSKKKPEKEVEKDKQKETEKNNKKSDFKKISKSNKERNYREKERSRSKEQNKGKENKENRKEDLRKKKERKRDLERYNVRSMIAEKPKKDQFGRDIKSPSRSSRSASPRRSRSHSWNRARKRRRRSRSPRRSRSRSHSPRSRSRGRSPRRSRSFRRSKSPRRSRSRSLRRSRTPRNKRHRNEFRSLSRDRERVRYRNRSRRSLERDRPKRTKKNRSVSRTRIRSRTPSPGKHRIRPEWTREGDAVAHHSYTREWTPSWSRSPTPPRPIPRHNLPQSMSPSWTPPLAIDKGTVQPENLTVILNNDVNKTKKKEKRKKTDKKSRDEYRKRKRVDRTPPPSKEVFASGDNILVSVSFNKTNEENPVQREVMGVKRKRENEVVKKKKEKNGEKKKKRAKSPRTKKKNKEIANLKPVAIIDLDRSPFKELTPSPKDIIVLSDSDNCEKEDESMMVHHHEMLQEELMSLGAQNQEDSAPQSPNNYLNSTGPKTPPEPQIKFLLTSKQSQLRAINNPLHDPNDEADQEIDPQEELEHRLDDILHKGPNTPPEPPSSPPSSPDAYDPFDPTKSRSPTPEPADTSQPIISTPGDTKESDCDLVDLAVGPLESSQKSTNTLNDSSENRSGSLDRSKRLSISPERTSQTRTPPTVGSEQTSESNDNKTESTEKITKSPERNPIGVLINQQVQLPAVVKPIISTSAAITSAPTTSNTSLPRTNLFNTSTSVSGTPRIATSVPQRIILPTPAKASPSKMSPLKTSPSKPPIKSTPIKPMPSKTMISKLPVPNMKPLTPIRKGAPTKPVNRSVGQNGNEVIDVDLDFDSPYSPGSSDYEDLFEPPAESTKSTTRQKNTKSPAKQNAFDNLFGSSPVFRTNKTKSKSNAAKVPVKMNKKSANSKSATKTVGVKIDEDNLKILDDLPNSAVEMQVKDKFLKKLNRQERVVEEVKLVLKPHYNKKHVTKEQYKDILRRAVPKICHNRSGEINPKKIQNLIEAYVKKVRHARKAAATTNQNVTNVATQQAKP